LRDALASRLALEDQDRARVAEFLGEMLRLPNDHPSVQLAAARQDPALMGDQIRRAWLDWLGAECAAEAVVLILEDLHWGDVPSVKLLDAALQSMPDRPLLVLALARPEIHDLFPRLWVDRGLQEIRLGALSARAADRLAAAVLGAHAKPEVVDQVIARAGGNPFFLEELLRGVAEGRTEIPETVLMGVQVRLEALEDPARRILRAASVFGQVFWSGAVERFLGADASLADVWLRVLVHAETITRRPTSRIPGNVEYVFRHALVREAAYHLLTEEDKVQGHRMAATWLEAAGENEPLALADHWERGGQPARAIRWYQLASEAALDGDAFEAAEGFAARAIACGASGQLLGRLAWLRADALQWLGDFPRSAELLSQALGILEVAGDAWYGALTLACHVAGVTGDTRRLHELAEMLGTTAPAPWRPLALRAVATMAFRLAWRGDREKAAPFESIVEGAGPAEDLDPAVAAAVLKVRAGTALKRGDVGAYVSHQEEVLEAHRRIGGLRAACFQSVNVGEAYMVVGELDAAERLLRSALGDAQRAGMRAVVAWSQQVLGNTQRYAGRAKEAVETLGRSVAAYDAVGERPMESLSLAWRANALLDAGDTVAAELDARRALEMADVPGFQVEPLCALASVLLATGRAGEALEMAKRAGDLAEQHGAGGSIDATAVHVVHAEALTATGDVEGARAVIENARSVLLAAAAKMEEPRRTTYLEAVPPHARILALSASGDADAPASRHSA
jgi:tetratricopeptide (TPR) repeat protein